MTEPTQKLSLNNNDIAVYFTQEELELLLEVLGFMMIEIPHALREGEINVRLLEFFSDRGERIDVLGSKIYSHFLPTN